MHILEVRRGMGRHEVEKDAGKAKRPEIIGFGGQFALRTKKGLKRGTFRQFFREGDFFPDV